MVVVNPVILGYIYIYILYTQNIYIQNIYIYTEYIYIYTEYIYTQNIYIYIYTYMHTCIHAYMHTCIHTYMHTYIHTYVRNIHTYIHTFLFLYNIDMGVTARHPSLWRTMTTEIWELSLVVAQQNEWWGDCFRLLWGGAGLGAGRLPMPLLRKSCLDSVDSGNLWNMLVRFWIFLLVHGPQSLIPDFPVDFG